MKNPAQKYRAHARQCADCQAGSPCADGKKIIAVIGAEDETGETEITASAAASEIETVNGALPTNLQWMPPGRQTVKPQEFDAPFEMNVTPSIASAADRQLQRLRSQAAAGTDAEPYGDFNHKDEGRAFKPKRFFWGGSDPKDGGVRMEVEWLPAGTKAVRDGSLCCISPLWILSKATKAFLGITHNVGGLVPRSAFHSIQAFAKADSSTTNQNQNEPMLTQEDQTAIAKLITDAIVANNTTLEAKAKSDATTAAAKAGTETDVAKLITEALKPVTDKLTAFETSQQDAVKASAKAAVQVHIARGAIAPEDTATIAFWEGAYLASASAAEVNLAKMPGKQITRIIRGNGGAMTTTASADPGDQFIAKAKAATKDNPNVKTDADAILLFANTAEGAELYQQFRHSLPGRNG